MDRQPQVVIALVKGTATYGIEQQFEQLTVPVEIGEPHEPPAPLVVMRRGGVRRQLRGDDFGSVANRTGHEVDSPAAQLFIIAFQPRRDMAGSVELDEPLRLTELLP